MRTKIGALFSIALIIFSAGNRLFAKGPHECKKEQQENRCEMTMQKMDCCPVEHPDDSCNCPDMDTNTDLPVETDAVVIFYSVYNPGDFLPVHYLWLKSDAKINKEFLSDILHPPLKNAKVYKLNHSFLI